MKKLITLIFTLVLGTGVLFAKQDADKTTGLEISRNEFSDFTVYRNKTSWRDDTGNLWATIYVYGNNPIKPEMKNTTWLRMSMSYLGDTWLFMNKAHFLVDGERKTIPLENVSRTVFDSGRVGEGWELKYRGQSAKEWAEFLIKIGNSKDAQMRLSGEQYYELQTFNKKQKAWLKKIGEAWLEHFAE